MERFLNRDISILKFNMRVALEAADNSLPLLERLKFIAIVYSNLDEFFMIRVGGILRLMDAGLTTDSKFSLVAEKQLSLIHKEVNSLLRVIYKLLNKKILPECKSHGIYVYPHWQLTEADDEFARSFFINNIKPVLTPIAVETGSIAPYLQALSNHIAVKIMGKNKSITIISIPAILNRFIILPSEKDFYSITIEHLILRYIQLLFPDEIVVEAAIFRITRNADLELQEDNSPDLVRDMASILKKRKFSACVRVEIDQNASTSMVNTICQLLNIKKCSLYRISSLSKLQDFHELVLLDDYAHLRHPAFKPLETTNRELSIFEEVKRSDILLHHPYESYDAVVRFIEEAANDPNVLAIKQTLYRMSENSPIVNALTKAATCGKNVTALVELKARFDEARNINQAKTLEESGAQVIYGIKGLKTHAKICLVIRKENDRITHYAHFGTGNYNEKTSRLYTDISLITANEELCTEGADFFNAICGYTEPPRLRHLFFAPVTLKEKIIDLINSEAKRRREGDRRAAIYAKMNSLADPEIIEALYHASKAGVKIRLNIRGICCLRPEIEGLSDNIKVVSIVGRFLEHSRIFYFRQSGDDIVYISSADWMIRNMEKRIELLIPIESHDNKKKLMDNLYSCFKDNVKSHKLNGNGTYTKHSPVNEKKRFSIQDDLLSKVEKKIMRHKNSQLTSFIPIKNWRYH